MIKKIYVYVFGKNVNREQVIIMLSLEGIFYEIEENEIWSFNYNIMEGVISLSLVNPYTAQRHEMKIEKIYNIFFVHSTNKKEKESPEYYPFVEMSYIGADKIEFPMIKIRLLNGYNLEFNLCIELYADKMFINAEDIVIDGKKYELP